MQFPFSKLAHVLSAKPCEAGSLPIEPEKSRELE